MAGVQFKESDFGSVKDAKSGQQTPLKLFTWTNKNKVVVQVTNYGATLASIKIPDRKGKLAHVVAGFDNVQGYQGLNPYFGATVGRVANRINKGKFKINNVSYQVSTNRGDYQLHGGVRGFDKVVWDYYVDGNKLILSYHSADLEEGFPGDVNAFTTYQLNDDNELIIEFRATTTKPTFINMTNHSYFNLAGVDKGATELYKHVVTINADRVTLVDSNSIPTGQLLDVGDTVFDLRVPKVLGDVINKVPNTSGFDHNFCITKGPEDEYTFVARVVHPDSGRVLEVHSNQPGVQFYTGNSLPEDKPGVDKIVGKDGVSYYKHGALCLETQNWPDAANHENFPNAILPPGQTYTHNVAYKFSVKE